ncbi:MAG: hypothetical protein Q4E06_07215 [Lautropia sp.]|nr:hypothetical protein [Lautropia sp.]
MKHLLPLPASWPVLPLLAGLLLTGGCDDRPVAPPPAAAGKTAAAPRPAAPATAAPDAARPTPTGDDTPARHETSPPGPQHSASPRQAPAGMPSTARPSPDPSGSRIDDALAARILQARQCSGCHQRDRKVVGPSWRQISDRLATLPDAPARLRNSIRQGSRGQWGPLSMPPQPQLAPAETDVVVSWILQSHP